MVSFASHRSGLTLIELLIVITVLGILTSVLLPLLDRNPTAARAAADAWQLHTHFQWLTDYQRRNQGSLPGEGGHKFVLSTWTSKQFEHTPENLDKYFTPGTKDPHWRTVRSKLLKGLDPWPDLASVSTADTHYCGRASQHLATARGADAALMATDNEDGLWNLDDGAINVLFADGRVRTYSHRMLRDMFGVGPLDEDHPIATYGPNSPIPACQKLDN